MKTTQHPLTDRLNPTALAIALYGLLVAFAAQAQQRPTIGILNIEGRGVVVDATTIGGMVRIEMEKSGSYDVIDWYDARELLARTPIDITNCYGKTCLLEAAQALHADKMLMGSVERYQERIAITLKVLDVKSGTIERSNTSEYLNLQKELQRMIEISVKRLFDITPDKLLTANLDAFNEPIDSPVAKANLSGPRFGGFYTTGIAGERMRADKVPHGGLGMSQVVSMIGWQQEIQYVNSGDFQCLFEFIFTGSGLESGRFIPAFSVLHGFRLDKQGWEIAVGPTFRFVRKAEGYYVVDENGHFDPVTDWHLEKEWQGEGENPYPIIENLDDRGSPHLSVGLVLGIGKTFKSGQLNIPVNAYVIPRKDGTTIGLTTGFNVFHSTKR